MRTDSIFKGRREIFGSKQEDDVYRKQIMWNLTTYLGISKLMKCRRQWRQFFKEAKLHEERK